MMTRFVRPLMVAFITLIATVMLSTSIALAQTAPRPLTAAEAGLLAQATAEGQVSVIIGFDASFSPQADADSPAALQQEAGIDAARADLMASLAASGRAEVLSGSDSWAIPFVALTLDAPAYLALLADPRVTSIEANVAEPVHLASTIPVINADDLWALGFLGGGYTVAVLDTGVLATHTALNGRVVAEACYSGASGSTPLCPNLATSQTGSGAASPSRCLTLFSGSSDCSHGTHVATTAAGNDSTIKGVARGANLIGVQVFSRITGQTRPLSYISDQVSGLNYVYGLRSTYNIVAVNLSLGGGLYTSTCDSAQASRAAIFASLRAAGIMPVVSAGNDSSTTAIGAPACISTAVSVGATTDADARASFSNSLPSLLTLFAPGNSVYAGSGTGGYMTMSGTSMAAPHVTGAFALLKSARPSSSTEAILTAMRTTGVSISVPGGTTPRINLQAAYNTLLGTPTPTATRTPTRTPTATFTPSRTITNTPTRTASRTNTPTRTFTATFTPSRTITNTPTRTYTRTNTATRTFTATYTPSRTITNTPTRTPTATFTPSRTITNTPTRTASRTMTPARTPTLAPGVYLSLAPNSSAVGLNADFSVNVVLSSGTTPLTGAAAYLNFNPALVEVVSITAGAALPAVLQNSFNNSAGQIDFAAGSLGANPSGTFTLATLNLRAKSSAGITSIAFNSTSPRQSSAVSGVNSILTAAFDGQVSVGGPIVTVQAQFQGRPAAPSDLLIVPLAVSVRRISDNAIVLNQTITTDSSGRLTLGGLANGTYAVRLKGSHTLAAEALVTISGVDKSLTVPLLREGDSTNDNVVNVTDFSVLASAFGQLVGNPAYNASADFNGNGVVDLLDFSLLAVNFGATGTP